MVTGRITAVIQSCFLSFVDRENFEALDWDLGVRS